MSWMKRMFLGGADASKAIDDQLVSFKGMFKGADEATLDSATAHHGYHTSNTGSPVTQDALAAMKKDVQEGLLPGQGGSMASIGTGNILTRAFNAKSGNPAGAMLMGGLIGSGGALATDGEVGQGALVGAVVGGGIKGIGTGIAKNIEAKFMGDLLGDSAGKYPATAAKEAVDAIPGSPGLTRSDIFMGDSGQGMKLSEIPEALDDMSMNTLFQTEARGLRPYKDDMTLGGWKRAASGDTRVRWDEGGVVRWDDDQFSSGLNLTEHLIKPVAEVAKQPAQAARSVRQEQLAAIGGMDDAALKAAGGGAAFKKNFLTGDSKMNVGQVTRLSGFAGAALSGMAFSSKQRDHRRGFNKRRGNRV
jgi:hypothetical protein